MNTKIDYKQLEDTCRKDVDSFFLERGLDPKTEDYIYIDNGSPILGVAHLDTVLDTGDYNRVTVDRREYIVSSELDDRLGVYTLLHMLPAMGIKTDILLTVDEERMGSTAWMFQSKRKYNWAYEFDRMFFNPVLYQYEESTQLVKALHKSGYKIDHGSYSDISDLSIWVCGINFGVGYEQAHTAWCMADTSLYMKCVYQFKKFYNTYKTTRFPYTPKLNKNSIIVGQPTTSAVQDHGRFLSSLEDKDVCDMCHTKTLVLWSPGAQMKLCDDCWRDIYEENHSEVQRQ